MKKICSIKVDKDRVIGRIDPKIYGSYLEHIGRAIDGGIYDEKSTLSDERGFRKDVLEAVRRIKCPIIRWPGGNYTSFYHWQEGIGPKESRPVKYNLAWRVEESNRFGTDEFIQYCRAVGAEPYICVNVSRQSTPEDAAHWVEYCNIKGNSYYAKLREKNGHPQPYNVKYWGIGNELYLARGKGNFTAHEYTLLVEEYASLMGRVDPTIKIIPVGLNPESRLGGHMRESDWNLEILKEAGDLIDYISMHIYYSTTDYYGTVAAPVDAERRLRLLNSTIDVANSYLERDGKRDLGSIWSIPGRKERIKIALDEWGFGWSVPPTLTSGFPFYEIEYSLKEGLYAAGMLNVLHRLCNIVTLANYAMLTNVIGMIFTTKDGILLTPIYHAFDLYVNHSGNIALETLVQSATFNTHYQSTNDESIHVQSDLNFKDIPYIDASATINEKEGKLYLATVNRHRDQDIECHITLDGFTPNKEAKIFELNGPNIRVCNGIKENVTKDIAKDFTHTFPAHSARVIEITYRK